MILRSLRPPSLWNLSWVIILLFQRNSGAICSHPDQPYRSLLLYEPTTRSAYFRLVINFVPSSHRSFHHSIISHFISKQSFFESLSFFFDLLESFRFSTYVRFFLREFVFLWSSSNRFVSFQYIRSSLQWCRRIIATSRQTSHSCWARNWVKWQRILFKSIGLYMTVGGFELIPRSPAADLWSCLALSRLNFD